jgi:hypothetical protein
MEILAAELVNACNTSAQFYALEKVHRSCVPYFAHGDQIVYEVHIDCKHG